MEGAYFSGPALQDATQIAAPDFIDLDLTPQLLKVFDSYYIVRLSWGGVKYRPDGTVLLTDARVTNGFLDSIHKFSSGDFIVIDTEDHEESVHAYHLVYKSCIMRSNREPHRYK